MITEEYIDDLERCSFASAEGLGKQIFHKQSTETVGLNDGVRNWLRSYRAYIGQARSADEHFQRISRLVTFCADLEDRVLLALGQDKFFY